MTNLLFLALGLGSDWRGSELSLGGGFQVIVSVEQKIHILLLLLVPRPRDLVVPPVLLLEELLVKLVSLRTIKKITNVPKKIPKFHFLLEITSMLRSRSFKNKHFVEYYIQ